MTPLEEACEEHFRWTVTRTSDSRYMVRLPLREEMLALLGDSFAVAQRRFLAIERKFAVNSDFKNEYVKFMEEYKVLGHMELSPRVENPQFVLPHHAIFRPDSSTTKTRVVFDATCKGSSQLSLNDVLYVGPIVQPPLLAIVLNWRIPRYVFKADAEKMFRQIWLHPLDRKFLQVLWRLILSRISSPWASLNPVRSPMFGGDSVADGAVNQQDFRLQKCLAAGLSPMLELASNLKDALIRPRLDGW
ncbi:uncharacterized protein LOC135699500 [Ochlerotatus camptorhynchus]|uniref:uncharacterized protein LOC135699500 n=1 Tax=Ochlerotatus camptorhynchus TaxID=644619 RepID=UPI0031DC9A86